MDWEPKFFPNEDQQYGEFKALWREHSMNQIEVRITRIPAHGTHTKYHAHTKEEEWFYVLSGSCHINIEGEWQAERTREDFVGQGAYGTIYSDEPGLVRKEMISTEALEELNAQAIGAELGLAPRVVAYESAVHGDPEVKAIVMQDLRDNYEPAFDPGIHPELIDVLGAADMNTSAKNRRFAMDHQKQMGALALKGLEVKDRHTGNVMRHKMTGRPIQLDWGITRELSNLSDKVEALVNATVEGFKASGQYDIAEIINDTAYDYVVGGQIKEAWDFTKEAFASLQKIKNPVAFPANQI